MAKFTSKPAVLDAAFILAASRGIFKFSRLAVAKETGLAESTISFHFKTMAKLRKEVVKRAVSLECLPILADVCSHRMSFGVPISEGLRKRAINSLLT